MYGATDHSASSSPAVVIRRASRRNCLSLEAPGVHGLVGRGPHLIDAERVFLVAPAVGDEDLVLQAALGPFISRALS